jgi:hypothetical protein
LLSQMTAREAFGVVALLAATVVVYFARSAFRTSAR